MAASHPQAVALIASGRKNDSGEAMKEWRTELNEPASTIDFPLYERLANPPQTGQVRNGEDYTFETTLLAVYGQSQFSRVCIDVCESIITSPDSNIAHGQCNTVFHRASTVMKTCQSMLNSLLNKNGNRRYNAQFYPLYRYDKRLVLRAELANALEWADHPWTIVQENDDKGFAYEVATRRHSSFRQFTNLWNWVDAQNDQCRADDDEVTACSKSPSPADEASPRDRHPALAGRQSTRSDGIVDNRGKRAHRDDSREPIDSDRPTAGASQLAVDDGEPAWASIHNPNLARCWRAELMRLGIDDQAQKKLFALAQEGSAGRSLALGLIGKLLKDETDDNDNS